MTIHEFIKAERLTASFERVEPNRDDDKREHESFRVTVRREGGSKTFIVTWNRGIAEKLRAWELAHPPYTNRYLNRKSLDGAEAWELFVGPLPTLADVLESVRMDCLTVMNGESFEDWAGELGYDPDSRKAERTFRAIKVEADDMLALLGRESFARFMELDENA
jgi:hypothetical protein